VSDKVETERIQSAADLERLRNAAIARRDSLKSWISVCGGTSCSASNARPLREALQKAITENRLSRKVGLRLTGCHGFCEHGPMVVIAPDGICYEKVKPDDAEEIVQKTVVQHDTIDRLLYVDPQTHQKVALEKEIPFYSRQSRTLLLGNQLVDSTKIDDYLATGGYGALAKVLTEMSP
jgi:NADH-quinone oxidoreductase subunit F